MPMEGLISRYMHLPLVWYRRNLVPHRLSCRSSRALVHLLRTTTGPSRSFATALHTFTSNPYSNSSSSSHPSLLPRSSSHIGSTNAAATSSKFTLDHPFWFPRPDPAAEELTFATDDELFHVLLSPSRISLNNVKRNVGSRSLTINSDRGMSLRPADGLDDWTQTLDPGLAFLALRSRPTFTAFLQCIHPFLASVYPKLKAANQHSQLVSDLLLRHPDPRLLLDLFEMDTRGSSPLRPSLVCSINAILAPEMSRGRMRRLSYAANLALCRAMLAEGDHIGLEANLDHLIVSSEWTKESAFAVLDLARRLLEADSNAAMRILFSLIRNSWLPSDVLVQGLGQDAESKKALVFAAMAQCALEWGMDVRARTATERLLALRSTGIRSSEVVEIILDICSAAIGSGKESDLDWAAETMIELITRDGAMRLPGLLLDAWLDAYFALPVQDFQHAWNFWSSIPVQQRGSISGRNIVKLSRVGDFDLDYLVFDILRSPPDLTVDIGPTFLKHILHCGDRDKSRQWVQKLCDHWAGRPISLSTGEFIGTVIRLKRDPERCVAVISTYDAYLHLHAGHRGIAPLDTLALVRACLIIRDGEDALDQLKLVNLDDEAVRRELERIWRAGSRTKVGLVQILRKLGREDIVEEIGIETKRYRNESLFVSQVVSSPTHES